MAVLLLVSLGHPNRKVEASFSPRASAADHPVYYPGLSWTSTVAPAGGNECCLSIGQIRKHSRNPERRRATLRPANHVQHGTGGHGWGGGLWR